MNQSLDRRGCDLEEVEETRAKEGSQGADGADGGADKADEGAEQLRLLRKELDALSLSLRSDPRESPGTSAWAPAEPASAEPASEPVFEARPWRADALPKPLEREVPEVPCGPCGLARFAAGAEPEVAAPAQRDMRSLGSYPPGAVIDPGGLASKGEPGRVGGWFFAPRVRKATPMHERYVMHRGLKEAPRSLMAR